MGSISAWQVHDVQCAGRRALPILLLHGSSSRLVMSLCGPRHSSDHGSVSGAAHTRRESRAAASSRRSITHRLRAVQRHLNLGPVEAQPAGVAAVSPPTKSQPTARMPPPLYGMTENERYHFDVNGFLVRKNMLSAQQVQELNEALEHNAQRVRQRDERQRLSRGSSTLSAAHGRGDTGAFMSWPDPWCQPFRKLLSHPPAVRLMLDLIGEGFHYHQANGITMSAGSEGHTLHGGGGRHGRNHHNAHVYR